MRTRTTVVAVVVGLILFTGTVRLLSQDFPFTIDLDVPLVSVDFTVVDTTGKPVTDLNRYDFQVFDNGVSRPIQNFSPVQSPYNLVLLLDCSGSTQDRVNMLVSTIARFADQLRPQDKAAIAVFGSEIAVVADWNGVQKPINLKDSPVCRGTGFYDALSWAEKKLRGVTGRRGIVVFSDGADSDMDRKSVKIDGINVRRIVPPSEDQEFQKLLKTVRESNVPFYFVAVDTDLNPGKDYAGPVPDLQQIRARLEQLAQITGGRIAYPQSSGEVVPMILQIGRDLGISYSLGFSPANENGKGPHKFEVRTRSEDYTVNSSRTTYAIK